MKKMYQLYFYRAFVSKVYDGDTITVDFDLGLCIASCRQKIRLYGINTPELRGTDEEKKKGYAARDFLSELILDQNVILRTHKDKTGKYGGWLAVVYLDEININELLIEQGYAVKYMV